MMPNVRLSIIFFTTVAVTGLFFGPIDSTVAVLTTSPASISSWSIWSGIPVVAMSCVRSQCVCLRLTKKCIETHPPHIEEHAKLQEGRQAFFSFSLTSCLWRELTSYVLLKQVNDSPGATLGWEQTLPPITSSTIIELVSVTVPLFHTS